jgi:pimeloyl-ACP methyl ester carboxylesterase
MRRTWTRSRSKGSASPLSERARARRSCSYTGAREWIPGLLTQSAPDDVEREVTAILSEFHPAGQRTTARAFGSKADLRDVLPRISIPTLLLYGDQDVRSPVSVGEDPHAKIPGSKLVIIPGVGHLCDVEAAERFNAEVRSFLRKAHA